MNDALHSTFRFGGDAELPRWVLMWGLALGMFGVAKATTLREVRRQGRRLGAGRTAAYLLLWVGMDVREFWGRKESGENWLEAAIPGLLKLFFGAFLLWGVAPMFKSVAAGWIGMIGIVLVLHFGLFHLLAVFWARRGLAVEPIMNRPLWAQTLAEFWGERWNRAFNQLMYRFIFRPGLRRLGLMGGTMAVFLVSGLIHEAVISFPAGGGYGGPTFYFVAQGVGLQLQRTNLAAHFGFDFGWKARLFTALVLLAPLPLLFHREFIVRVILPFLEVIGAGSATSIGG